MTASKIQIYDIYDLWYVPWWKHPYAIILYVIFTGILLFILMRFIKRAKQRVIIREPWEQALSELQSLNLSLFQENDMHKQFYTYLTSILKMYLAQRYQISLSGKTDKEIVLALKNTSFPKDLSDHLEPILQGAILIKFSNQEAVFEKMRFDLKHSVDIIRNTIPSRLQQ